MELWEAAALLVIGAFLVTWGHALAMAKGKKGDVGPVGPKGEDGDPGPQGPMGPSYEE